MDRFKKILENRHEYAKEWKARTGGKVLGYYETYFPEEMAYAAGILPIRILAKHYADDKTDRQMYGNCYVTRDMLNQFLLGYYDYVDGLCVTEGCQWLYNAFQTVVNDKPELFYHYYFMPDYPDGKTSKDVMRSELVVLQDVLEKWTGKEITTEAIDKAIDVYNEFRFLMRSLNQLRRMDNPVLLGSEAMDIMLASQVMDKAEFNEQLKELLPILEKREPVGDRIRFLLIGSETYDSDLERVIEDVGGNVVIDELDNGTSYVWNDVLKMEDRLMAIGLRYLGRPHSALKDSVWRRRPQHIYELFEDWQCDGAIIAKQIYCHPHGTDNYAVWKILRERNIPYHFFERDSTVPYEETKLRMETLVNMIKPGLNRLYGWSEPATE